MPTFGVLCVLEPNTLQTHPSFDTDAIEATSSSYFIIASTQTQLKQLQDMLSLVKVYVIWKDTRQAGPFINPT